MIPETVVKSKTFDVSLKSYAGKPNANERGLSLSGDFNPSTVTLSDLRRHTIDEGKLFVGSTFKPRPESQTTGTNRRHNLFIQTQMLIMDIDGGLPHGTPADTIKFLLDDVGLRGKVSLIYPSSSYQDANPKVHAIFLLDAPITDSNEYKSLYAAFMQELNIPVEKRGDEGEIIAWGYDPNIIKVAQPLYGTKFRKEGYKDCPITDDMVYQDDSACIELEWLRTLKIETVSIQQTTQNSRRGTAGQGRVVSDYNPDYAAQKTFEPCAFQGRDSWLLDRLQYIANVWRSEAPPYDYYNKLVMALHHASDGSVNVRDYVLNSPIFDGYSIDDREVFSSAWVNMTHRTENIAGRYWIHTEAVRCGWGWRSQYELKTIDRTIDSRYLSDSLGVDDFNQGDNVLIKSQTGTGKTHLAMLLGSNFDPERVLIVTPFKNLCRDAASKAPFLCDVYEDVKESGERTPGAALVSTPQFVISGNINSADFDFIVLEEIHELMQHLFSKKNHMTGRRKETLQSDVKDWLNSALNSSAIVLMIDAGIDENTVHFIRHYAPVTVLKNTHIVKKADVVFLESDSDIWDNIGGIRGRVVINTDNPGSVETYARLFDATTGRKMFQIHGKVTKSARVKAALADIEAHAKNHDLAYNGAMGTGVSISETTPDLFVQVCEWLPATTQIQHLNRYRNQDRVWCIFRTPPAKYGRETYATIKHRIYAQHRAELNALKREVPLPDIEKSEDALFNEDMHIRLEVAKNEQSIDPLGFYINVLKNDGRNVEIPGRAEISDIIKEMYKQQTEHMNELRSRWREGKDYNMEVDDLTPEQYIVAKAYSDVAGACRLIPEGESYDTAAFVKFCEKIRGKVGRVERALKGDLIPSRSLAKILSPLKGHEQAFQYASVQFMFHQIRHMLPTLDATISHEDFTLKAPFFIALFESNEIAEAFNASVSDTRNHVHRLMKAHEGNELAFKLLTTYTTQAIGMKIKRTRRKGRVDGKVQRLFDEEGNKAYDYCVQDADLWIDVLAHRQAHRQDNELPVIADLMNLTWNPSVDANFADMSVTLHNAGLYIIWLDEYLASGSIDAMGIAFDVLTRHGFDMYGNPLDF
ncbi:MAG: DEAD/DEAH box helicase [Aggregatilineales bacterium]